VIDPGHGGRDPGAVGPTGILEKNVALAVALELKKVLEKAGLKVYMTREKDVFVDLRDRTKFANDKKADLFVSVHANANRSRSVKGYKMYFLSQARNEAEKMAAMRENAVIELEDKGNRKGYEALQDVLASIVGTEYQRESQELSIIMEQGFGAGQRKILRQHTGVGQGPFYVLNGAYMPAVLVEMGHISHPDEEKSLADKKVQQQLASILGESIIKFKKQYESGQ
jgi:N-acetylmuramoyl-L-alanine amidase